MRKKALVLVSGGLDSVVLLHHVVKDLERDVTVLFFDYKQNQLEMERKSVAICCRELEILNLICIPLNISHAGANEYIPARNLIFLSTAVSIAEEQGFEEVYIGLIDNQKPAEESYIDTSSEFIKRMNALSRLFGVKIYAPYVCNTKADIAFLTKLYGISIDNTWSCMHPIEGERCGKCGNCTLIDELKEVIAEKDALMYFLQGDFDNFKNIFINTKIREARLLINNTCNTSCDHCFYGFNSSTGEELSVDEWEVVIDKLASIGVENIHFAGKEPFFDDKIFILTDYIKAYYPTMTFDVVTNGINIPTYLKEIKSAGFSRICLSVDGFADEEVGVRNWKTNFYGIADMLEDIPITLFIDVFKDNLYTVEDIVDEAVAIGINDFWIRPVFLYGKGEDLKHELLSVEEFKDLFNNLLKLNFISLYDSKDISITLHAKQGYAEHLLDSLEENIVSYIALTGDTYMGNNLSLHLEVFCGRFLNQITITSDGFILGCGVEVSRPDYDKISIGNVRNINLMEEITKEKERVVELNKDSIFCAIENNCSYCGGSCYINNYCYSKCIVIPPIV